MFLFSPDCSENPYKPGFGLKDYNGKRDQCLPKKPNLSAPKSTIEINFGNVVPIYPNSNNTV